MSLPLSFATSLLPFTLFTNDRIAVFDREFWHARDSTLPTFASGHCAISTITFSHSRSFASTAIVDCLPSYQQLRPYFLIAFAKRIHFPRWSWDHFLTNRLVQTIFLLETWDCCFNWWGRYIAWAFRCQSCRARKTRRLLQGQMMVASRELFSVGCGCPEWHCKHWFLPPLPLRLRIGQVAFAPSPWAISNIIDSLYYKAPFMLYPPIHPSHAHPTKDKALTYIHFHSDQPGIFILEQIGGWFVVLSACVLGWRYDGMDNI